MAIVSKKILNLLVKVYSDEYSKEEVEETLSKETTTVEDLGDTIIVTGDHVEKPKRFVDIFVVKNVETLVPKESKIF